MYATRHVLTVTTDGSGDAIAYTNVVNGRLFSCTYVKAGSGSYSDGVDFVITAETTGEILWDEDDVNATATRYTRAGVHSTVGVALTYDGTRTVNEAIVVANQRIKVVIASGGDTKTGTFHFVVG